MSVRSKEIGDMDIVQTTVSLRIERFRNARTRKRSRTMSNLHHEFTKAADSMAHPNPSDKGMLPATATRRRILLLSNSIQYGHEYLDHAEAEIQRFLSPVRQVLFVPYAMFDREGYAAKNIHRFGAMGFEMESIHSAVDPRRKIQNADAVFIGGGNTFRLLKTLYDLKLLDPLREKVRAGAPYIGSSAGSVVAGPTLQTTNDMPIVYPPSFIALGLVEFQINAHYIDRDPDSPHRGETREERLLQYLEENSHPVLALREGAMVEVNGTEVQLRGSAGARLYRRGRAPEELPERGMVCL
jgi:dipeptidase E